VQESPAASTRHAPFAQTAKPRRERKTPSNAAPPPKVTVVQDTFITTDDCTASLALLATTKMADDYTLMTTESMALVLNDDGCCVRHPSIRLKEYDDNGDVFLKEACPECQSEFQSTQDTLLQKRRELNSQLNELQETEEEEETPMDERRADFRSDIPAIPKPPAAMADGLSLESLAAHMLHIQQMQDILMFQKDKEVTELKLKVEQQQKDLMDKQVEIALLKERMTTQKNDMEKELRLIKRAVAMDREKRMTGGGGQDIRIEQLHVHKNESSPGDVYNAAVMATQEYLDGESKRSDEAPAAAETTSKDRSESTSSDVTPAAVAASVPTATAPPNQQEEDIRVRAPNRYESKGEMPAILGVSTETQEDYDMVELQDEEDRPSAEEDIEFIPTAEMEEEITKESKVKTLAAKLDSTETRFRAKQEKEEEWEIEYVPDNAIPPAQLKVAPDDDKESIEDAFEKKPEEVDKIPDEMWEDDRVESEEEDEFDTSAPLGGSPVKNPTLSSHNVAAAAAFKSKPGPLTKQRGTPEHPNEHRKDPLDASMNSLKPPGKLQPPSNSLPKVRDLPEDYGMGMGPVDEFEVDNNAPPMVPLTEQVTISSEFEASDRFTPRALGPDDEGTIGPNTIGPTVASSTYGEDRQVVKDQLLLDPYGDKGIYSGQVLLSTGLPHGGGKMIYEDDGRTYEGDWRHGRWHGWGRATFSNGDAFEGFYKYDQR